MVRQRPTESGVLSFVRVTDLEDCTPDLRHVFGSSAPTVMTTWTTDTYMQTKMPEERRGARE
jgi:hypothetical protein